jgi:hypothetical protein
MPCRSDYLAPTAREEELQKAAQLLIYVLNERGLRKQITKNLTHAAGDSYCTIDFVPELCKQLKSMTVDEHERIVYNARSPSSRRLADWWERHQAADRVREQKEQEQVSLTAKKRSALQKLTPEERHILGLDATWLYLK